MQIWARSVLGREYISSWETCSLDGPIDTQRPPINTVEGRARIAELTGYLKNLLPSQKSVYEQVVYDLGREQEFADRLEKNNAVKVYAKLPGWFTVPTPLGTYNPDWAVLIEKEGLERLYFVVETKGSDFAYDLRGTEVAKIKCGRAHFKSLGVAEDAVRYMVTKEFDNLLNV